jgi:hypothetical protein
LAEAKKSTHEGSVIVATYLESDEDHTGDEFVYPWVTQFRRSTIEKIVDQAGFRCIHLDMPHPFDQRWFLAVHPDNTTDFAALARVEVYSYETYLQDEIEAYGGQRRRLRDYLTEHLAEQAGDKRHLPR